MGFESKDELNLVLLGGVRGSRAQTIIKIMCTPKINLKLVLDNFGRVKKYMDPMAVQIDSQHNRGLNALTACSLLSNERIIYKLRRLELMLTKSTTTLLQIHMPKS